MPTAANDNHSRVIAIVPAAGLSRRMGRQKLALPFGDSTVLEQVVRVLSTAALERIIVVLGQTSRPLASLVHPPTEALLLERDTPDMRSTIEAGLERVRTVLHPTDRDAFMIVPADQPLLRLSWFEPLLRAHSTDPTRIRTPTFEGRRGHPVLFPWAFASLVPKLPPDCGINQLLHDYPSLVMEHAVEDADVLDDLDAPADYERLLARARLTQPDESLSDRHS